MQDIPASGYVVPANQFKPLLTSKQVKELETLMEDPSAGEEICELLNSCIPNLPPVSEVHFHGDEDNSDDLEHGNFYIIFDEEDLFEKTPKPALAFLREKNAEPSLCRWTVWG